MKTQNNEAATKYKVLTTIIVQFNVRNCENLLFS